MSERALYESEEDEFEVRGEDARSSGGFAFGTVVFPVEKVQDFVDAASVLINPVDSYLGKYVGLYLSDKVVGSGNAYPESDEEFEGEENSGGSNLPTYWKVLGTFKVFIFRPLINTIYL